MNQLVTIAVNTVATYLCLLINCHFHSQLFNIILSNEWDDKLFSGRPSL